MLTIKKRFRRNWSFLKPVPALWQLTLGAFLLTLALHSGFAALFCYRSSPMPRPTGLQGELTLLNCAKEPRWLRQIELLDPAGATVSSGKGGYLSLLPSQMQPLLLFKRPQIRQSFSNSAVPRFRPLESKTVWNWEWHPLPPLKFYAGKAAEPPLVLSDNGTIPMFSWNAFPSVSADKPSVLQIRSFQGISRCLLLSSCGKPELDEAARTALAESDSPPGNYLFYWPGGHGK